MKPLSKGGVLRCCIESLRLWEEQGGSDKEGTALICLYHSDDEPSLVVRNGRWVWPGRGGLKEGEGPVVKGTGEEAR